MNSTICIGIDPGKTGFISIFDRSENQWIHHEIPKLGKEIDVRALDAIFCNLGRFVSIGVRVHAIIENVHAIYGVSANSTFDFGYTTGLLEMALVTNNIPFTKVAPKAWQKQMWEGVPLQKKSSSTGKTQVNDTKNISLIAAKRLFPNMDFRRTAKCSTPDHNKVDSILMAEYCRRNF